jgi:hypothetical protein
MKNAAMPLYRATALIAVMMMIALAAGYAAGEHVDDDQEVLQAVSEESPS